MARLIELGYGAEIEGSGGADGSLGTGSAWAFEQWFIDEGYAGNAPFEIFGEGRHHNFDRSGLPQAARDPLLVTR